ncbi:MAG: hypothetical protein KF850_33125 [Labilithrix sp.]|nr:hypothetical protein [Labilithrix sp.]MBX3216922.1 hypothetical protein [Labilithrix sp.]
MKLGTLVKPSRPGGSMRLGRVVGIAPDGRLRVHAHVAPVGAYEGSVATYTADELVEVPIGSVVAYLMTLRAELEMRTQVERQVTEALRAVEGELELCSCGGGAGRHADGCALARAIR